MALSAQPGYIMPLIGMLQVEKVNFKRNLKTLRVGNMQNETITNKTTLQSGLQQHQISTT